MHAGAGVELSVLTGGLCRSAGGSMLSVCVFVYGHVREWSLVELSTDARVKSPR